MQLNRLVVGASLALLASCKDSSTGPTGFSGTVSFTYSGAISGNFTATGVMPAAQGAMETSAWAAGEVSTVDGVTYVASATPRNATSHDFFGFYVERTTPGSSSASDTCTSNCAFVAFEFGMQNGTGNTWLQLCSLTAGTVTITEISGSRVKGTFSGTGECVAPNSSTPQAFTVTNGTFDVALVSGLP